MPVHPSEACSGSVSAGTITILLTYYNLMYECKLKH
jgi:hypothetical protein